MYKFPIFIFVFDVNGKGDKKKIKTFFFTTVKINYASGI